MAKAVIAIEGSRPDASHPSVGWAPADGSLAAVVNRPLVLHALDTVRRAGATETVIVAQERTLAAVVEAAGDDQPDVRWMALDRRPSAADAVLEAARFLEHDRFLVHVADGLLVRDRGVLRSALEDGADATVFFASGKGRGKARVVVGIHAFSPAILDAVERTSPGRDGRRALLDAVDRLAAAGGRVQAAVLEDWWRYRPDSARLLQLNRMMLDSLPASPPAARHPDVRLEGRVQVHPTAVLRNAIVRGPAVIGAHAHVTDAYVGPYTTVGDGASIENSEIESSIVWSRARIRHVGVRIEDSIVGAGASVGRDFAVPKSLRLLVGRDAQIKLA